MARIQTPGHVSSLQSEFKIREPFGLELLETIQPVAIATDVTELVASQDYPRKAFGMIQTSAVAASNAQCELTSTAGTGKIFQLNGILHENDIAGRFTYRVTDGVAIANPVAVTTKVYADLRILALPDLILSGSTPLTAAPDGRVAAQVNMLGDTSLYVPMNVVLGGGAYFLVRNSTVNETLVCTFFWTEYLLEDR